MTALALIYLAIGIAIAASAMIQVERDETSHEPRDIISSVIAATLVALLWLPIVANAIRNWRRGS